MELRGHTQPPFVCGVMYNEIFLADDSLGYLELEAGRIPPLIRIETIRGQKSWVRIPSAPVISFQFFHKMHPPSSSFRGGRRVCFVLKKVFY